jgi:DNA-binding transcriptional ArsR family regulator
MSGKIERELRLAAPVFAALGDANRMRIVARLSDRGPMSISHLATGAGVTRQAITRHLHVLEGAGLVHGTRQGREIIFELDTRCLSETVRKLDLIARRWDEALDRLRLFVE